MSTCTFRQSSCQAALRSTLLRSTPRAHTIFGLYLDRRWEPPWLHDHVDWPDFGVPSDPIALGAALLSVLDRARAGERVEIGCLGGGHGRTGTALFCLAALDGVTPSAAVAWVRDHYCSQAIETADQEALVLVLAERPIA